MDKISTKGMVFTDNYGRERFFYGMNIVDKRKSCDDNKFLFNIDDEVLSSFIHNGMNIIRLGTTWSMVEPEPGQYNDAYLDDIMRIFDLCEKYGIYVLFDMHQDLYSSACIGDGAPDWATVTDGVKPVRAKLVWGEGYFFHGATQIAFDNFWNNARIGEKGILDYYSAMWQHISERFADHPAFWGFDMLNEPFPGTDGSKIFKGIVKNGLLKVLSDRRIKAGKLVRSFIIKKNRDKAEYLEQISGDILAEVTASAGFEYIKKFDTGRYSDFLNRISSAIRDVNKNGILVMENCYWSNICIPCSTPEITVDGKRDKDFCFTPHGYDFMVDTPLYKYASNDRVRAIFEEHARTQERLKCPLLVAEWGGVGGAGEDWLPHIEYLMKFFENHRWSYTYWHYDDTIFSSPLVSKVLNRPHPIAVAGKTIFYEYNTERKEFNIKYSTDENSTEPTVIYVPTHPYCVEGCNYISEKIADSTAEYLKFYNFGKYMKIKIKF